MDYSQLDEIPRHKKKSKAKTPKKSQHKHTYKPCVIEYPLDWYKKEHERSGEKQFSIGTYCAICGKIGELKRWYHTENESELNPETRTLPIFWTEDFFPKYVELETSGK